jgi:uncharacterized protein
VVNKVVAPDATYVSLNTEDSELKRILPWAGTSHGPGAFIWNLSEMFRYWQNENFEVTTMFGEGEVSPYSEPSPTAPTPWARL